MSGHSDDFALDDLITLDEAIERFPIFRRNELLAAMRSGELRHWPRGRQRFTTERWLQDWIRSQLRGGENNAGRKVSVPDTSDLRHSDGPIRLRMTPEEDQIAARLLAQANLRKPHKNPSRSR